MADNTYTFLLYSLQKSIWYEWRGNMFPCNDRLFYILVLGLEFVYCGLAWGPRSSEALESRQSPSAS
jgi:hypothetical protein